MPPNERKGRVHTSTVTVAVLDVADQGHETVSWADVDMRFTKATGAGGQHRNKRDSCVVLTHRPSGLQATCDGRDQHANRREAWELLQQRVRETTRARQDASTNQERRGLVGTGQRGDKVRTYRCQDEKVTDSRSGKTARLEDIRLGKLELVW